MFLCCFRATGGVSSSSQGMPPPGLDAAGVPGWGAGGKLGKAGEWGGGGRLGGSAGQGTLLPGLDAAGVQGVQGWKGAVKGGGGGKRGGWVMEL